MAVIRWEENLDALRALLAERPEARPTEYVTTHRNKIGGQVGWLVRRAGSRERLMFVPDNERFVPLRDVINRMFEFFYCTSCGVQLLEGETVECSLCEARRVMQIIRMGEELT